ncbi:peptidoglycan DD-metalloendopeptidase family protein [Candidatus Chlorohelix sp.]|uniref:peptidoglycan DD-metalloendopeptidase family protein n=1 Tax=Candidatus Chlorohelix sp. TaxID=3139201 RepID=UPI00301F3137
MSQYDKSDSKGGSSTAEAPRPEENSDKQDREHFHKFVNSPRIEARQLLDEIAGVAPNKRHKLSDHSTLRTIRKILFSPITSLLWLLQLILRPLIKLDLALLSEMRKFLKHPGTFFWFNRLAPEAAAQHFGTTSTEEMTHHARRYAAHVAVMGLALVVVAGGGFSGAVKQILSPEARMPVSGELKDGGYLTVTGNMKGIVLNSLGTTDAGTKRVKVYTVQAGDTLRNLATRNNISLDTILYANQIDDPDQEIKSVAKLVIPPVTGMWHVITRSSFEVDTIASIAARYNVDPKVIIDYAPNQLAGVDIKQPLKPGNDVMVPGGVKPLRDSLLLYKVRDGETMQAIADKFGISRETIAIFNGPDEAPLQEVTPGLEITILPVSGIRVRVLANDNVTKISQRFFVPVENIVGLSLNNLQSKDTPLTVGDYLIVPNGKVPAAAVTAPRSNTGSGAKASESSRYVYIPPAPKPVSATASRNPFGALSAPPPGAPVGTTGSMMWPMRGLITTYYGQRIWYGIHQGLDISTSVNAPIVAADGGVVIFAGWSNDGYGNMVEIAHSNGLYTLYGHFNSVSVRVGQQVAKGQLLGLEGSTGNSTGPHLHFEVRWGNIYGQTYDPLRFLR